MNELISEIENLTVDISMLVDSLCTITYKLEHKYKDSITSSEWKDIKDSDEMYELLAQMQMCNELMSQFRGEVL